MLPELDLESYLFFEMDRRCWYNWSVRGLLNLRHQDRQYNMIENNKLSFALWPKFDIRLMEIL